MVGTNALILHFNDDALQKMATVWNDASGNALNLCLKRQVPINLTLSDLHIESLNITSKGIKGWIKAKIRWHLKILRRDFRIKGKVRIHLIHKISVADGDFISETKMIDFVWIRYPRLFVQNKVKANLMNQLDSVIYKFNPHILSLFDNKLAGEIGSDKMTVILKDYLSKTSFLKTWKGLKPTLSISGLSYKHNRFILQLKLLFWSVKTDPEKLDNGTLWQANVKGMPNYRFKISYTMLDEFFCFMLREQINLWPVFRTSQITTGLLGSAVFTRVELTLRFLGSIVIEWEFSSFETPKPVKIGIKNIKYYNWRLPKFLGGWILNGVSRKGMKLGDQLIRKIEDEIALKFGKNKLTIESRELPDLIAVAPTLKGIFISLKEPLEIIIH